MTSSVNRRQPARSSTSQAIQIPRRMNGGKVLYPGRSPVLCSFCGSIDIHRRLSNGVADCICNNCSREGLTMPMDDAMHYGGAVLEKWFATFYEDFAA